MSILEGSSILITGGTGSFGKTCAKTLLEKCNPSRLVILSRDEQKHVDMARNVLPPSKYPQVRYFVGDVRDRGRLGQALRGIDYVIHAAAMKHVDIAEYNPQECISTNIGGAENLINACIEHNVKRLVALSTDKAAAPVNLYGATKLCSDKLFSAANALAGADGTRFCAVRYGNVIGSNGSVIPFFQKKRHEGKLPITSYDMTRFVITLEQGVEFVLKAFERMHGGELFVPKIPSVSILDIAKAVAPTCETEEIGIRPGEKMHECMIPDDEARQTLEFDDHFVVQPSSRHWTAETPGYVQHGKPCPEGFSYSSDNNGHWLSVFELKDLIAKHCPDPTEARQTAEQALRIRRAA